MPRDPRTYITVHDGMPNHPKIEGLSDGAFRLLLTCWCYCSEYLTDGHIKQGVWNAKGTPKARRELVAEGLAEPTPTGIFMHDYTEHQRTADEVAELREKRANAGRLGGMAKAERHQAKQTATKPLASATASAKQKPKQTPSNLLSKPLAESETEVETETDKDSEGQVSRRARALPQGWNPPKPIIDAMHEECPNINLQTEHRKFTDYYHANGKPMKNWDAAWRNWIRKANEYQGNRPPAGKSFQQHATDSMFDDAMSWAEQQETLRTQRELEA